MQVSMFRNFTEVVENLTLPEIFEQIRSDRYAPQVNQLRSILKQGDKEGYDHAKKSLPAFTPSATFKDGRKAELIDQYSGTIHLDFDKIPDDQLEALFLKICSITCTFACFHSPSINGLKVFVKVNSGADYHSIAYRQIQEYYESTLGIKSDPKCKDLTRLCFVSYDTQLFVNINSQTFPVKAGNVNLSEFPGQSQVQDYYQLFEDCISFTERKVQYYNGNRNSFIYLLASNCNRKGIPEEITSGYISDKYDLNIKEVTSSINSAYRNHSLEFGKYPNLAKNTISQSEKELEYSLPDIPVIDHLKNSPFIPEEVYQDLPSILKSGIEVFPDLRERDVFFTGAIAILSGCLPEVKGVYAQQTIYPNLFSFIIAPAASGKGALKFAKTLADLYHDNLLRESREAARNFKAEEANYKARMRSKTDQEQYEDPPVKPPFKVVFIPANSSYAKLLLHLQENEGEGIICETEADTMGNVLKHDWGNYSDLLRKAFQHERVSSSKKTNDEFIEVDKPRLSIAISGTPNQVTGLISSSEDGLFSRFLFYAFKADLIWRDVSPYACSYNLTDYFGDLSTKVYELVLYLQESPTIVELTHAQWDDLNATGSIWLQEITLFNGEDTSSIIKRLGIILYRLCMVLTTLRKFDNGDASETVTCTDTDYQSAKLLTDTFLQHSLLMYHNLPKNESSSHFNAGDRKKAFLDTLPEEFKRAVAVEIGKTYNLSPRTVDSLLSKYSGTYFTQIQFGCYKKCT